MTSQAPAHVAHPKTIKSFVTRAGRTTTGQAKAFEALGPRYLQAFTGAPLHYADAFGRDAQFAHFYRSLEAYRSSFRNKSDVMVLDPASSEYFKVMRGGVAPALDPGQAIERNPAPLGIAFGHFARGEEDGCGTVGHLTAIGLAQRSFDRRVELIVGVA